MHQKDADTMTNSVVPGHIDCFFRISSIWVYTVCPARQSNNLGSLQNFLEKGQFDLALVESSISLFGPFFKGCLGYLILFCLMDCAILLPLY